MKFTASYVTLLFILFSITTRAFPASDSLLLKSANSDVFAAHKQRIMIRCRSLQRRVEHALYMTVCVNKSKAFTEGYNDLMNTRLSPFSGL